MVNRYAQVIFWQKYLINELIGSGYDQLAAELTQTRPRQPDEPLGQHTLNWPPKELENTVFRSLASYDLPRLLVEYLSIDDISNFWVNLEDALFLFNASALTANNTNELVVVFAEGLAWKLVKRNRPEDAKKILKRLLGTGKLNEDNINNDYRQILTLMQDEPILSRLYNSLSPEELDQMSIYRR